MLILCPNCDSTYNERHESCPICDSSAPPVKYKDRLSVHIDYKKDKIKTIYHESDRISDKHGERPD